MSPEHKKILTDIIDAVTDAREMAAMSDTSTTPISRKLTDAHIAACNLLDGLEGERDCKCHGVLMKEAGVQPHTIACEWEHNR